MYVLLLASHWISVCLQGLHAFALWPRCLVCKIKEECFPASCFLGDWAGRVPSCGECCGSAILAALLQCTHNLLIQHQFFMHSLFWVYKCGVLFHCMKLSANRSDHWRSLLFFCFANCFPAPRILPATTQRRGRQNQHQGTLLAWRMKDRFTRVCWKVEISRSRGWVVSSDLLALLPQKVGGQGPNLTFVLNKVSKVWWYGANSCRV